MTISKYYLVKGSFNNFFCFSSFIFNLFFCIFAEPLFDGLCYTYSNNKYRKKFQFTNSKKHICMSRKFFLSYFFFFNLRLFYSILIPSFLLFFEAYLSPRFTSNMAQKKFLIFFFQQIFISFLLQKVSFFL